MVLLVQHRNNTAVEEANFDFNDSADKQLEYKTFWERLRDSMMNAFGNQSDDISHVSSISSRSVQHPVTGIHYGSISWYLWMHSVKKREIYSHLKKIFRENTTTVDLQRIKRYYVMKKNQITITTHSVEITGFFCHFHIFTWNRRKVWVTEKFWNFSTLLLYC